MTTGCSEQVVLCGVLSWRKPASAESAMVTRPDSGTHETSPINLWACFRGKYLKSLQRSFVKFADSEASAAVPHSAGGLLAPWDAELGVYRGGLAPLC